MQQASEDATLEGHLVQDQRISHTQNSPEDGEFRRNFLKWSHTLS